MRKKEVIKKSLGFSLIIYFSIISLLLISFPFLIFIMIENNINLDDFLLFSIIFSPIFYFVIFRISHSFFKRNTDKTEKNKFDKICIFIGKYVVLIIIAFVFLCFLTFYLLVFYFSDVSLRGFFVCENDLTFSQNIKSYGEFFITNRGVCVQESACKKLEGFAECEKFRDDGYYSKAVIKGADKDNFDFKFLTGLKKTENSKEEFVISDLDDEFNLPKYTCKQTQCDFNTSGKIDFYQMKKYGMLVIKDDDVAILRSSGTLIFRDIDLDNFQFKYLGGKYSIIQNQVYYNNDRIIVDTETFQYLGGKYSKDKNHVYYKNEIIDADTETFIYKKGGGKAIGKGRDKNGTWIKGVLQEK